MPPGGDARAATPVLVEVPAGTIVLRDDRVARVWTVRVRPFLLDRVPVTQALYAEVTGARPSTFEGADHPVETVSWLDAVAFCNALSRRDGLQESYTVTDGDADCDWSADGYRLPTEAEWEHACRAGSSRPRYGDLADIAWYAGNADDGTRPVGWKRPNAWGLHDMLGNVWEWCWDRYDPEVYGEYRVFRGGGWADPARGCLATNRRRSHPTFRIDDLGFRVARAPVG